MLHETETLDDLMEESRPRDEEDEIDSAATIEGPEKYIILHPGIQHKDLSATAAASFYLSDAVITLSPPNILFFDIITVVFATTSFQSSPHSPRLCYDTF